jgi:hypothetical protein
MSYSRQNWPGTCALGFFGQQKWRFAKENHADELTAAFLRR